MLLILLAAEKIGKLSCDQRSGSVVTLAVVVIDERLDLALKPAK